MNHNVSCKNNKYIYINKSQYLDTFHSFPSNFVLVSLQKQLTWIASVGLTSRVRTMLEQ